MVLTRPQGRFSEEGFLGPKYKPFATGGDPNAPRFEVEGVVARGITDDRQKARRELLDKMNTMGNAMAASPQLAAAEEAKKAAYELILGQGKEVFDLSKEKPELRDRYGRHTFGQECLVARRLVETGVPYVVINYPGGWDTHSNHFATMRRQCPQLDQGLAMLLAGLEGPRPAGEHASSGVAASSAEVPRWTGSRPGTAAATITATSSPSWSPAADSRAATWSARRMPRPKRSRSGPCIRWTCSGSIYQLAGIDANARLPHPMGIEAHVLPSASEGVKSAGLLTEIM